MIEGCYVARPAGPDDHQVNYFVSILDCAVHHQELSEAEALSLLAEFKINNRHAPRLVPELGGVGVANSATAPLNGVLRIIFKPEEHEYCTSGWL